MLTSGYRLRYTTGSDRMIVSAEQYLYPENLLQQCCSADDRIWWLAHTKPRQEKALAHELFEAELPFFLPCTQHRVRVRNQVITRYIPLFSGYAFVRVTMQERTRVFSGNRIARLVSVLDQELLTYDLQQVCKLLQLGEPVQLEDHLLPGTAVTIRSGPLAGIDGTIVRATTGTSKKFVVRVNLLQRGISVTLDAVNLGKVV